jgi:uncharacterized coiled-coil protein SlyX
MASKILKGLAIAAGTGLAIGFGSKRRRQAPSMSDTSDNSLPIQPLLYRLDRIEARMSAVEARPVSDAGSDGLAQLDQFVQRQRQDLETLRAQMERRFAEVAGEVPAILASLLGPRVDDLRARLLVEMRESVEATLTSFERDIDNKISLRTSALEKALIDQSSTITTLGQRAIEADENFQKLISAVERLCERRERPVLDLPFERQLTEAFQRQPGPSALPPDSGFRPRIVKEDAERPRHRTPLTSL